MNQFKNSLVQSEDFGNNNLLKTIDLLLITDDF